MSRPVERWLPAAADGLLHDVLVDATTFAAAACDGEMYSRSFAVCGAECARLPQYVEPERYKPCPRCRLKRPQATDGAWSAYVGAGRITRRELARRYVERGEAQDRIARAFGVGRPTVRRWLDEAGIKRRRSGPAGYSDAFRERVLPRLIEAYEAGATLAEVADAAGVGPGKAAEWLRDAGVHIRHGGKRMRGRKASE